MVLLYKLSQPNSGTDNLLNMKNKQNPSKVNFIRKELNHSRKTSQLLQEAKSIDSVRKWKC